MQLPSNIFDHLEEATVEGWVKWDRFQNVSRVFDFVVGDRIVSLQNRSINPDLWVEAFGAGERRSMQITNCLRAGEWVHLAVVSGADDLKLYFNGVRLTAEVVKEPDTFRSAEYNRNNLLGRSNAKVVRDQDADFAGQMDEIRVWHGERTEQQIQEGMSRKLTGQEPGLAALWNLDDPANPSRDATVGGRHGRLLGNARVVATNVTTRPFASPTERGSVLTLADSGSYLELPRDLFSVRAQWEVSMRTR